MKRLFALCIILTMTLVLNGLVGADITWTPVTSNPYEDTSPQVKGDYIVWQGYVDGDWEIFLYNITTGESKQITENNYNDMSPQTDGDYVVWQGYSRTGGEIFLYEIGDDRTIGVTNDDNLDSSPQIADGLVVWTSHQVGDSVEPGDIFLYEVGSGVTYQLTDNTLDDDSPRINGQEVMWVQTDDQSTTTKYLYDLPVGPAYEASEGYVWRNSPQTDRNLTVLTRHDGSDREIFLYNSDSRNYHQITDNNLEDRYPSISGNHIAWMAGDEVFLAQYKCLDVVSPRDNAVLSGTPPPTLTWEGIGYDEFKVEFCPNRDFEEDDTFTLPLRRRSWLSGNPLTPNRWEWRLIQRIGQRNGHIYWRVKGKDNPGNEALSEIRSFSIESAKHTVPRPRRTRR